MIHTTKRIEVDSIDDYLLTCWNGGGGDHESDLRALMRWFNKQVLRAAYADTEDGDVHPVILEDHFSTLRSDDPQKLSMIRALEDIGIDYDKLKSDYTGQVAIYNHITNCLDGSTPPENGNDNSSPNKDVSKALT
jgi:hypothetical protein